MRVLINLIRFFMDRVLRNIYWIFRLLNADIASTVSIAFPIIVEGKGRIRLGANTKIGRNVELGVGEGAKLHIVSNGEIQKESIIRISKDCNLLAGDAFKLGKSTRLFVQQDWEIQNNVHIETHCDIFSRESGYFGKLTIGQGTHIGDYTIIDVCDNITIGDNVAIGPNCTIYSHDHDYTNKKLPAWQGGVITKPVKIADGAWIGSNVTILPGVCIGERCVVAAGSVVTKDVIKETIVGGVPAKPIKTI
ncbi:acyltransferase [Robertkochia solimangrovi]|uniref:acyltransferase n=1 Tax=Robertkochia solimangrovi TaxID=2213046 RepID=UPI001181594D|nr:DapH/DapD/GlmU-related protein [Robertkochia solimangrovi]TRZ44986.1 hypothetical protein DMZ48_04285 [Robertkochia solimangrovi]